MTRSDRYDRLDLGVKGESLRVDMLELGIAVRMIASLLGLTDLAAKLQAFEQVGDAGRRNPMSHSAQGRNRPQETRPPRRAAALARRGQNEEYGNVPEPPSRQS
jgi:hypothetical protein